MDLYRGRTVTWKIGEEIRVGGGAIQSLDLPHEELPPQCAGRPYWLVGDLF
jgi:hypothetical protein